MEIRTVVEGRIYVLFMNPITGRCEDCVPVAASSDYQKLCDWYNSYKCEPYRDGRFTKNFTAGHVLENYNPVNTLDLNPNGIIWHHGIYDEWVKVEDSKPIGLRSSILWLG